MTLFKKWAIWKSDYDQSSCAYLRPRKRGSEVEREGWARTGHSEDPFLWGVSQTQVKRKTEDQESFLEPWPEWLGGGAISESAEEDRLEKTKSCAWGTSSWNAWGDPGSQVPQAAGFLGLGRTVSSLHTFKMETIPESPGSHQGGRPPFSWEPPPAAWPWRSPRITQPLLTAPRGTSTARFPSQRSGLHPETSGQASKLRAVAEGAPAAVCPPSPGRADGTLEGAGCLCRWHVYDPASPYSCFWLPLADFAWVDPSSAAGFESLGAGAEQSFL